jgi:hypothetical protein
MALYGKGSLTLIVDRVAAFSLAKEIAVWTALAVMSDPSVGTRMRLNMAGLLGCTAVCRA